MENVTIRKFLEMTTEEQTKTAWYDWFCKDTSLAGKTPKLVRSLKTLLATGAINIDTTYVFFKNNCPMNGPLYDDYRICSMETGDVLFTVIHGQIRVNGYGRNQTKEYVSELWGRFGQEFGEYTELKDWKDIVNFFKANKEAIYKYTTGEVKAEVPAKGQHIPCPDCGGHGVVTNTYTGDPDDCHTCGGSGAVWQYKSGAIATRPGGRFIGSTKKVG